MQTITMIIRIMMPKGVFIHIDRARAFIFDKGTVSEFTFIFQKGFYNFDE